MTVKLNLLFIAMDLLTLLAYPFVFMYSKMRRMLNPQEIIVPAKKLATASVIRVLDPL